jgi:general secretion pathway protein K
MRHPRYFQHRRTKGFALAAVLWLLAGMTILAAMISQSNQILAQRQAQLKLRADAEQEFLSSRSEALYWLSSSKSLPEGYGWPGQLLKVDGRGYAGSGNSTLQVQDVRGLLNLNQPNRERLARLLVRCGAEEAGTNSLLDALEDYMEAGELKRLNGAKSFEYSSAGMAMPRYAPLLAEPEIWRVYGWKAIQGKWTERKCFEDVTVYGDKLFNPGFATPGALASFGLTSEQVNLVGKERDSGENVLMNNIQNQDASQQFLGVALGRMPSDIFRITHTMPGLPLVFRYELVLKSDAEGIPWEISSPRRLPMSSVIMPTGRANWPKIDQISETDKNALTQPTLPF